MEYKEYHKIETLFERDMEGNKKLIEGKYRNHLVEFIKDKEWIFTEKIDGTNIRVMWDGHKVSFGGRTNNADLHKDLVAELERLFGGEVNEQIFEQSFGEKEVYLHGEGYGAGIQSGGRLSSKKEFALFDVQIGGVFLERENIEEIAKKFDCKLAPIMMKGTIDEAVDFIKSKPKSTIAIEECEIEGVVGTPRVSMFDRFGNRIIVKIKVEDFVP